MNINRIEDDEEEEEDVFAGIFFLLRRRQEAVFRVILDHGLGEDFVLGVALHAREVVVHEGGHLVHVQLDPRNVLGMDIFLGGSALHQNLKKFFIAFHIITSRPHYIVFKTL